MAQSYYMLLPRLLIFKILFSVAMLIFSVGNSVALLIRIKGTSFLQTLLYLDTSLHDDVKMHVHMLKIPAKHATMMTLFKNVFNTALTMQLRILNVGTLNNTSIPFIHIQISAHLLSAI